MSSAACCRAMARCLTPREPPSYTPTVRRHFALPALAALCLASGPAALAQEPGDAADSVEEVSLDELDTLDASPSDGGVAPMLARSAVSTEHEFDPRLLVFPVLLVLALAWNVRWK